MHSRSLIPDGWDSYPAGKDANSRADWALERGAISGLSPAILCAGIADDLTKQSYEVFKLGDHDRALEMGLKAEQLLSRVPVMGEPQIATANFHSGVNMSRHQNYPLAVARCQAAVEAINSCEHAYPVDAFVYRLHLSYSAALADQFSLHTSELSEALKEADAAVKIDGDKVLERMYATGRGMIHAGLFPSAAKVLRKVRELRTSESKLMACSVELKLGEAVHSQGDSVEALALYSAARESYRQSSPPGVSAFGNAAAGMMVAVHLENGRPDTAVAVWEEQIKHLERQSSGAIRDGTLFSANLKFAHLLYTVSRYAEAERLLDGLKGVTQGSTPWLQARLRVQKASILAIRCLESAALAELEEGEQLVVDALRDANGDRQRNGLIEQRGDIKLLRAYIHLRMGNGAAASAESGEVGSIYQMTGVSMATMSLNVNVADEIGLGSRENRIADRERVVDSFRAALEPRLDVELAACIRHLGAERLGNGDYQGALRDFREAERIFELLRRDGDAIEAWLLFRDLSELSEVYPEAVPLNGSTYGQKQDRILSRLTELNGLKFVKEFLGKA